MSNVSQMPSENEVQAFLGRLSEYRTTLVDTEKKLLDSMIAAALGHDHEKEEVKAYWVAAVNPAGPAGGYGRGVAVATPYGATSIQATPWGASYAHVY